MKTIIIFFVLLALFAISFEANPDTLFCVNEDVTTSVLLAGATGISSANTIQKLAFNYSFGGYANPSDRSFSCIDGRDPAPVFATPAGDFGEFLLGLTIYQRYCSLVYGCEVDVHELFVKYLKRFPSKKFYLHTSSDAIQSLARHLKITEDEVLHPTTDALKELLLKNVINPDFIGCGHVKNTIVQSDKYMIPAEFTKALLKSFYKILWGIDHHNIKSSRLLHVVLQGDHQEQAILNVITHTAATPNKVTMTKPYSASKLGGGIKPQNAARVADNGNIPSDGCGSFFPLIKPMFTLPSGETMQFFVNHPTAVDAPRVQNAKFFARLLRPIFKNLRPKLYKAEIDQLANKRLLLTVDALAPTLSIFSTSFTTGEYLVSPQQ